MNAPLTDLEVREHLRALIETVNKYSLYVPSAEAEAEIAKSVAFIQSQKQAAVEASKAKRIHIKRDRNQTFCGWGLNVVSSVEMPGGSTCLRCLQLLAYRATKEPQL